MEIFSLEAQKDAHQEIADKVEEYVSGMDFATPSKFFDMEDGLIVRACEELNWHTIPDDCVFEISWDSEKNEILEIREVKPEGLFCW